MKETNELYNNLTKDKKLKIICDWDEIIQPLEPYSLWKAKNKKNKRENFSTFFKRFWKKRIPIEYFSFGSKLDKKKIRGKTLKTQTKIKNSKGFYKNSPFLKVARDILDLIKDNKIEKIIFLSAYEKEKFSEEGDKRKNEIFEKNFGIFSCCELKLISFKNEKEGLKKSDWIINNTNSFDAIIDDNPIILDEILNSEINIKLFAPNYHGVFYPNKVIKLSNWPLQNKHFLESNNSN